MAGDFVISPSLTPCTPSATRPFPDPPHVGPPSHLAALLVHVWPLSANLHAELGLTCSGVRWLRMSLIRTATLRAAALSTCRRVMVCWSQTAIAINTSVRLAQSLTPRSGSL